MKLSITTIYYSEKGNHNAWNWSCSSLLDQEDDEFDKWVNLNMNQTNMLVNQKVNDSNFDFYVRVEYPCMRIYHYRGCIVL